jgi:cation transport ATPase
VTFNLSYFVFVSIATSAADQTQKASKDARAQLAELDSDTDLIQEAMRNKEWRGVVHVDALRKYHKTLSERIEDHDKEYWKEKAKREIRGIIFAVVTAALGLSFTALLFYATIHPHHRMLLGYIWMLAAIGIFPVFVFLALNIKSHYYFHELHKKFFNINVSSLAILLELDPPNTPTLDTVQMQLYEYKKKTRGGSCCPNRHAEGGGETTAAKTALHLDGDAAGIK